MKKETFTVKAFLSEKENGVQLLIINRLKGMCRAVSVIVALIIFPLFSPENNWGGSVSAQTPAPNFVFDANDAHKGILIPRVSLLSATDTVTVPSPTVSLLLYNTATVGSVPNNLTPGFYYWNGTKWQSMSGERSFPETFVEFYALMPSDNTATIAQGSPILFPSNGPTSGRIIRSSTTPDGEFVLPDLGTYSITWQVSIAEAGQLVLVVNGTEEVRSVVGRATGTSQIIGNTLLTTSTVNTRISINNPSGNPVALTVSPIAGGTKAVSASIIIKRLQ